MRGVLLALLLVTPAWGFQTVQGDSISCTVLTKKEVRQKTGVRKSTGFACTNLITGEVLGAALTVPSGRMSCPVKGVALNGNCVRVDICPGPVFEGEADICVP